jgi:CHAT domain-containing protein/Tfp pilus assembly protein PilF
MRVGPIRRVAKQVAVLILCAVIGLGAPAWGLRAADPEQAWERLNGQVTEAYQVGDYAGGSRLAEQAYELARKTFGARDSRTLESLDRLALLYKSQGRYGEAEPLLEEALQLHREGFGPHHPDTLQSLHHLAALYLYQGRYGEVEPLYQEALELRREVLGPRHPDTLLSLNNLAFLYYSQGRYGEAEPLFKEALQLSRKVLGPRHPGTLGSLHNLALLYQHQGRYGEAEPLFKEALQLRREVLGPQHPGTLASLHGLALLYHHQGRYGEAEPLFKEALRLSREVLGRRHPRTPRSLHHLALLYAQQGRYGEAEPLFKEASQLHREVLGPRHPDTLRAQLNSVFLLANLGRSGEALQRLREMEPSMLAWAGSELFSAEAERVRRQLVVPQATFQDIVLSLALREQTTAAQQLAGTVMLRWRQWQGEEEAYLARLLRRSEDPKVGALAQVIIALRGRLSALTHEGKGDEAVEVLAEIEAKERELGQVSGDYKKHLEARKASLEKVRAALPQGAGLVEFREYRPVYFRTGVLDEPHWAALLLVGSAEPVVVDLGPIAETQPPITTLVKQGELAGGDQAAQGLYQTLFGPFEPQLSGLDTVYLAPAGALNLVPFARLKLPDGRYWEERQVLRLLQTGHDLVRPKPDRLGRGLLALGGIDFEAQATVAEARPGEAAAVVRASAERASLGWRGVTAWQEAQRLTREVFRAGLRPLPASREEIDQVAAAYRQLRQDEPVETWFGTQASEGRLKALSRPPRVLHLATYGLYLADDGKVEQPMLLGGIVLAGTSRALGTQGEDGLLYGLEAQALSLEGTELVVLSACATAQGSLDYGEGVYGLVRALRIAGARQVLVTLWPVSDGEARDFITAFYRTWLEQDGSDPAVALRETRLAYITHPDPRRYNPRVWAPYALVGP